MGVVHKCLNEGKRIIKAMDINSAMAVKRRFGNDALIVFLKRDVRETIKTLLGRLVDDENFIIRFLNIEKRIRKSEIL